MEIAELIPHIEALIFASEKPLTTLEVTELLNSAFGFMEDKITLDQVEAAVDGVKEKYVSEFYPFEIVQSGGGWQFLTKKEYHKTIAQLNGDKFMKRLSAAALETLAIIAYKQPVTKGEVEAIRGVSADYAIQKLLEKELIVISGRNEKMPGHPLVYATSKAFMDYFGINSSDELPKIKEVLAEQMVEPSAIVNGETVPETEMDEDGNPLAVSENGELIENAIMNQEAGSIEIVETDEVIQEEEGPREEDALSDEDEDDAEQPDDEVPFDDEKKQVTEEIPGNEAKDEESEEEEKKEGDEDEPAY
ncbi:SMC-Scp complex subunit ScpB [Niabella ginsengisoli]|uniref:SMC-Scp complex subunit ScpB n=3 Tax=Niabella ginsengisoli TaxID=522298 RepID=A0ABS9SJD3_9BACT|nr:SMC-Scp complex subunit ScpB [Niabella ginsengisoli]MCH5598416.1 SMC-Scp complex subunit ScpB [Niabella ginsengisoli]